MPTKKNQDLLDLRHASDKKASKPLMEKRRRARINHSLAQLKALVIDPNTSERSRQTKLEKADILELTVKHLHEIKRQQRTVHLLESRHPKKKFEIGYEECAREVELFLSNLIDPQRPGLDGELQRRLKDHLSKRLEDFRSIEPLVINTVQESPVDEELNKDVSLSPSPPSVINSREDLPLCVDEEVTDSSDLSPLSKMLNYYSDLKEIKKRIHEDSSFDDIRATKRSKNFCSPAKEGNPVSYTCQSSLDTDLRPTDPPLGVQRPEKSRESNPVRDRTELENFKECRAFPTEAPGLPSSPHISSAQYEANGLKKRSYSSSSSNLTRTEIADYYENRTYAEKEGVNMNGQSTNMCKQKLIEQIPLVPRQLANGDWALVLPASLVPTEKDDSYPLSAFRLVVPTSSTSDVDNEHLRQRLHASSSPLSSTVSDMSMEEYCSRSESDPMERMERSSPDSTQIVWRPW